MKLNSKDVKTIRHFIHVMRKPAFCICQNYGADKLRGNREAEVALISALSLLYTCR